MQEKWLRNARIGIAIVLFIVVRISGAYMVNLKA